MADSIQDIRMIQRAMEQRWPINEQHRRGLINRLMRIVADPASSERAVISASKALIAAEKQNQDDEHKQTDIARDNARRSRLAAIAARLGISESAVFDAEAIARGRIETNGGNSDET